MCAFDDGWYHVGAPREVLFGHEVNDTSKWHFLTHHRPRPPGSMGSAHGGPSRPCMPRHGREGSRDPSTRAWSLPPLAGVCPLGPRPRPRCAPRTAGLLRRGLWGARPPLRGLRVRARPARPTGSAARGGLPCGAGSPSAGPSAGALPVRASLLAESSRASPCGLVLASKRGK